MENFNNVSENIMNKDIEYVPTSEELETLVKEGCELLCSLDYPYSRYGVREVFSTSLERKGWFLRSMKNHPNYNGNYQLVFHDVDCIRYVDPDLANECIDKAKEIARIILSEDWRKEAYVERVLETIRRNVEWEETPQLLAEDNAKIITEKEKEIGEDFRAFKGMKLSRLLAKIGSRFGLDKHVDMQEVTYRNNRGELVTVIKNMGWNYVISHFGDATNPIHQKKTAVISVHPIDYWLSSYGTNWASCHNIVKDNDVDEEDQHDNMYSGGCTSYMLDTSTIIFYYLPNEFNGNNPELERKERRCLFMLGEDKLIQSRLYPDGRDGGQMSLVGDVRIFVQKVVADIIGVENNWETEKGKIVTRSEITSKGVHYRDYNFYNDVNVSYLNTGSAPRNHKRIIVGARQICPCCGEDFERAGSIVCADCDPDCITCTGCGCIIEEDGDGCYDENGNPFCFDCVEYCEECDEYHATTRFTHIRYPGHSARVCDVVRERDYVETDEGIVHMDDFVITEEGYIYPYYSDSYKTCSDCCDDHDVNNIYVTSNGEFLCEHCARERGLILVEGENRALTQEEYDVEYAAGIGA